MWYIIEFRCMPIHEYYVCLLHYKYGENVKHLFIYPSFISFLDVVFPPHRIQASHVVIDDWSSGLER